MARQQVELKAVFMVGDKVVTKEEAGKAFVQGILKNPMPLARLVDKTLNSADFREWQKKQEEAI